jgi:hypothetical protein
VRGDAVFYEEVLLQKGEVFGLLDFYLFVGFVKGV